MILRIKTIFEWLGALHSAFLVLGALGFTTFLSALIVYAFAELKNPTFIEHAIITAVAILIIIIPIVALLGWRLRATRILYARDLSVSPHFSHMAYDNAECDRQLFDRLFLNVQTMAKTSHQWQSSVLPNVYAAEQIAWNNIEKTILRCAFIFSSFTGDTCAVAMKLTNTRANAPDIIGVWRDTASYAARGDNDDQTYHIATNTAFVEIVNNGKPYFVCDNLQANDKYHNPRPRWWDDYNATLVHPVRRFDKDGIVALLCIDNLGGNFDNPQALHYVKEICARISVMLFRAESLGALRLGARK